MLLSIIENENYVRQELRSVAIGFIGIVLALEAQRVHGSSYSTVFSLQTH